MIAAAYNDLKQNKPITVPSAAKFNAFASAEAAYNTSKEHEQDEQFWMVYVQPLKHHAYTQRCIDSFENKTAYQCMHTLTTEECKKLQNVADTLNISESSLYIGVSALWVQSMLESEYVSISLPICSTHSGMVSNVLPLLLHIPAHATIRNALIYIAQETKSVLDHQQYQVEKIRKHANYSPNNSFGPYVNVMLFNHGDGFDGCSCSSHFGASNEKNDLQITFWTDRRSDRIDILFDGTQGYNSEESLVSFKDHLVFILNLIVSDLSKTVAKLDK